MIDRRQLLCYAALASASFPLSTFAATARANGLGQKRLILIFLRGAVDCLNVFVPYGEGAYYAARPTIAIKPPGGDGGAIDLDGRFGLHPSLRPLYPLWQRKSLAFVAACGSPDPTRSHFDGQAFMETATPGLKTTQSGWLNRVLASLPAAGGQAVSFDAMVPLTLRGRQHVGIMPLAAGVGRTQLDRPDVASAFGSLYAGAGDLGVAFSEERRTHRELLDNRDTETRMADNGSPHDDAFSAVASRLAHIIRTDPSISLAFMSFGGWDTHAGQGNAHGRLAAQLGHLSEGLASLESSLGEAYDDTVILVVSEFGRTMRENNSGGTDHGHGTVFWVLGGGVNGGMIHGEWPGLADHQLHENRDLAVTTDFRAVYREILRSHLRISDRSVETILSGESFVGSRNVQSLIL